MLQKDEGSFCLLMDDMGAGGGLSNFTFCIFRKSFFVTIIAIIIIATIITIITTILALVVLAISSLVIRQHSN